MEAERRSIAWIYHVWFTHSFMDGFKLFPRQLKLLHLLPSCPLSVETLLPMSLREENPPEENLPRLLPPIYLFPPIPWYTSYLLLLHNEQPPDLAVLNIPVLYSRIP